jgi:hypothetical protein
VTVQVRDRETDRVRVGGGDTVFVSLRDPATDKLPDCVRVPVAEAVSVAGRDIDAVVVAVAVVVEPTVTDRVVAIVVLRVVVGGGVAVSDNLGVADVDRVTDPLSAGEAETVKVRGKGRVKVHDFVATIVPDRVTVDVRLADCVAADDRVRLRVGWRETVVVRVIDDDAVSAGESVTVLPDLVAVRLVGVGVGGSGVSVNDNVCVADLLSTASVGALAPSNTSIQNKVRVLDGPMSVKRLPQFISDGKKLRHIRTSGHWSAATKICWPNHITAVNLPC